MALCVQNMLLLLPKVWNKMSLITCISSFGLSWSLSYWRAFMKTLSCMIQTLPCMKTLPCMIQTLPCMKNISMHDSNPSMHESPSMHENPFMHDSNPSMHENPSVHEKPSMGESLQTLPVHRTLFGQRENPVKNPQIRYKSWESRKEFSNPLQFVRIP